MKREGAVVSVPGRDRARGPESSSRSAASGPPTSHERPLRENQGGDCRETPSAILDDRPQRGAGGDAPLAEIVRDLAARVAALEALVPRPISDEELLAVIDVAAKGRAFNVPELRRHCRVDASLKRALAGMSN